MEATSQQQTAAAPGQPAAPQSWQSLSPQQRWLCERVVYLRRRCLAYESAVLAEIPPPMDAGTYSNHANVLQGYLRKEGTTPGSWKRRWFRVGGQRHDRELRYGRVLSVLVRV